MPSSTFRYPSSDGAQITAYRWDPAGAPRAVIQLTHGMGEHAQRYDYVAGALNDAGFAVYAQDHRGHGASANPEALGDTGPGSWPALVEDIGLLSACIRAEHPGLPLIMLGHSMESFAVQQYLLDHSADVDGVALTGTAAIDVLERPWTWTSRWTWPCSTRRSSPHAPTSTGCPETRRSSTPTSPRCGFGIDPRSTKLMFLGARRVADPAQVAAMRSGLPLYVAVGEADPVNGGLALLTPLTDRYAAAGLTDVTVRTYPGARHEVLNETNRDEIIGELISWIDRVLASSR